MNTRLAWLPLLAALACSPSVTPLSGCDPHGNAEPLCGFRNPEDLALLPSGRQLLVSEYGGMDRGDPGVISRLDLAGGKRTVLFRAGDADASEPDPAWGAADCPGPPSAFSPHGIDLVRHANGGFALLVVNHGGRESVEMFEVVQPWSEARLRWRGCAVPPEGSWLNDVVGRADGGFFVSHMMPRRGEVGQAWEFVKAALLGRQTGHVLSWSQTQGFVAVAGSEAALANGVELSADESVLFVNATLGGRVRAVELATGRTLGEVDVDSPDNSTWAADGRLWVASLSGSVTDLRACDHVEQGACPVGFRIVAVDPKGFTTEVVYEGDGVTMGAGTVGLQVDGDLYVGSFAGDRILRVRDVAGAR